MLVHNPIAYVCLLALSATAAPSRHPQELPNSVSRRQTLINLNSSAPALPYAQLGDSLEDSFFFTLNNSTGQQSPGRQLNSIPLPASRNYTIGNSTDYFNIEVAKCATRWDLVVGPWQLSTGNNPAATLGMIWNDAVFQQTPSFSMEQALIKSIQANIPLVEAKVQAATSAAICPASSNPNANTQPAALNVQTLETDIGNEFRRRLQQHQFVGLGGGAPAFFLALLAITGGGVTSLGFAAKTAYNWLQPNTTFTDMPVIQTAAISATMGLAPFVLLYMAQWFNEMRLNILVAHANPLAAFPFPGVWDANGGLGNIGNNHFNPVPQAQALLVAAGIVGGIGNMADAIHMVENQVHSGRRRDTGASCVTEGDLTNGLLNAGFVDDPTAHLVSSDTADRYISQQGGSTCPAAG